MPDWAYGFKSRPRYQYSITDANGVCFCLYHPRKNGFSLFYSLSILGWLHQHCFIPVINACAFCPKESLYQRVEQTLRSVSGIDGAFRCAALEMASFAVHRRYREGDIYFCMTPWIFLRFFPLLMSQEAIK